MDSEPQNGGRLLVDLSEAIDQLCDAIGVEPKLVREIRLRAPRWLEAIVYETNEEGSKFVLDPETPNAGVATRIVSFEYGTANLRDGAEPTGPGEDGEA